MTTKHIRNILFYLLIAFSALQFVSSCQPGEEAATGTIDNNAIVAAFSERKSSILVQGEGVVVKVLPDDLKGSRHQKFIVRLQHGHTVLIAHNIDLAPRIDQLKKGDTVRFAGEYEYNSRGGVVHWTHHDPKGRHRDGWIRHNDRTYK